MNKNDVTVACVRPAGSLGEGCHDVGEQATRYDGDKIKP
jgi:hypothetical protein